MPVKKVRRGKLGESIVRSYHSLASSGLRDSWRARLPWPPIRGGVAGGRHFVAGRDRRPTAAGTFDLFHSSQAACRAAAFSGSSSIRSLLSPMSAARLYSFDSVTWPVMPSTADRTARASSRPGEWPFAVRTASRARRAAARSSSPLQIRQQIDAVDDFASAGISTPAAASAVGRISI